MPLHHLVADEFHKTAHVLSKNRTHNPFGLPAECGASGVSEQRVLQSVWLSNIISKSINAKTIKLLPRSLLTPRVRVSAAFEPTSPLGLCCISGLR